MLSPMDQPKKVVDGKGQLDYDKVVEYYPWVIEKGHKCIISPDADGFLCGLFMSHYFGWKIKGFYDGKVLLLEKGLSANECVFLDVEIFRKEIRSVGQHMVAFRNDKYPPNWDNFSQSIQANNLRGFDYKNRFLQKYPFGTIHLLLAIAGSQIEIKIEEKNIGFLLYADGTFKNLLNYPENCLSWLKFLGVNHSEHVLYPIFFGSKSSISKIMQDLSEIFKTLSNMQTGRRGADKLYLSDSNGALVDVEEDASDTFRVSSTALGTVNSFLDVLASKVGWTHKKESWQFDNLALRKFSKGSIMPTQGRYLELMKKSPLSLAIGSRQYLEYTLEGPDRIL